MTTKQNDKLDENIQEETVLDKSSASRSTARKSTSSRGGSRATTKSKSKISTPIDKKGKSKASSKSKTTKGKAVRAKAPAGTANEGVGAGKQKKVVVKSAPGSLPRLQSRFRKEIAPQLLKEFNYSSPMQVPRLTKVVLNIGLGEALENAKAIENATNDLSLISGQRPIATRARKSIANFKVREGMVLGLAVSLRGRRMYEFFDRLISSALPRIRDFRGISRKSFDGRGNYTLGIREQVIFPEIDYNSIDRIRGLQVVVVTTASTDQEGLRLLELMGVPFTRDGESSTAA